jgi:glyoxylase-like metal-dependent hydrolase (beta-lactamase superfamily II)
MDPFNDDPVGAYLASLNRVAEMPIQLVLPAHGEPFTDPASCITGLKEHHRRRLVRTAQLVETPTQTRAVADQLFPYARGPIEEMMATLETAAHLIHLEQLQLVKRVEPRRWVSVASKAGIDDPTDR